jgi:hypothetical protein
MVLTLNQIIKRLKDLQESHRQLNTFFFGDPHEFDANGENIYPALFVQSQPGTVDRINRLTTFNFKLFFYDLVGVSTNTEGNELEVQSDMASVAQDFLAMLMYSGYRYDWVIKDSSSFELKTEQLNDMVAGVVVDISISVDFLADVCQAPADTITFENNTDMARTKIYTYTATGSEGNSWSVPSLSGKAILAAWRAGFYKRVVNTAPDDDEKIQVGTTDLSSGRGILGSGTATLNSGDQPGYNEKFDFLYYE